MIVIGAEITTNGRSLERDLRRDARAVESVLGGAFKTVEQIALAPIVAVNKVGAALTGVVGKALSVQNIIRGTAIGLAGAFVLRRIDDAIENAGALEVRLKGIANQTGYTRREVGRFVADVNDASAGMLDFSVSSEAVNRGLLTAVPPQAIERLARYSSQLAVARGEQDQFKDQFANLIDAAAGGDIRGLGNFGIDINNEDLKGLDFDDRNARILELTLDQLEAKTQKLGTTGREIFFVYKGIFGNIEDIRTSLSGVVLKNETVQKAVRYIADLTGGIAATLRREKPGEVIGALFESVVKTAGALAVDLGEAIGIGISRGVVAGLDMLGVSIESLLGEERGKAVREYAKREIGLGRTREAVGQAKDAFTGPEPEDVGALTGLELRQAERDLKLAQRELRKLRQQRDREERRSSVLGTAFDESKFNEDELNERIFGLRQTTGRGSVDFGATGILSRDASAAEVKRLRLLTRSLERGRGGANASEERRIAAEDTTGLTREQITEAAIKAVREEREELSLRLNLGDIRPVQEKVSAVTGSNPEDGLFSRLADNLTGPIDEAFDYILGKGWDAIGRKIGEATLGVFDGDGVISRVFGKAADAGDYIADLSTKLFDAVIGKDWAQVGTLISDKIVGPLADAGDLFASVLGLKPTLDRIADSLTQFIEGVVTRPGELVDQLKREVATVPKAAKLVKENPGAIADVLRDSIATLYEAISGQPIQDRNFGRPEPASDNGDSSSSAAERIRTGAGVTGNGLEDAAGLVETMAANQRDFNRGLDLLAFEAQRAANAIA